MTAMVVMAIAERAEMIWLGLTKERMGPLIKKMSSRASMKMLNILLPNRLPIARSIAPIFTAAIETTTSGRDVETAIKILPTNVCPKPVASATPHGHDAPLRISVLDDALRQEKK